MVPRCTLLESQRGQVSVQGQKCPDEYSQTFGIGKATLYEYNYKDQTTKITDALGNITQLPYAPGFPSCGINFLRISPISFCIIGISSNKVLSVFWFDISNSSSFFSSRPNVFPFLL